MRRIWKYWLWVGCLVAIWPSVVKADVTGTILGVVADPSGAIMQGVQVRATNVDTNAVTQAVTDTTGEYRMLALPVGRYTVRAEFSGFQVFLETGIILTVNEEHRVDIVLRVGATTQEVSVHANAAQVETTSTQLGQVVEEKTILEMPLNGRSFLDLMTLQPGVAPSSVNDGQPGTISVNGQREEGNGFLVNGGDVSNVGNFQAGIQPNLDSIQEFRLLTNSFDAEYGRFNGALTNTITKSGSNRIHGSAFDFLRNDAMDARGFFDTQKGSLKRNQFGYTAGGPAIKNKLFWFTDYQGTRQINGGSASEEQVLTQAQRQGDFGVGNLQGSVDGDYWAQLLTQRLGYTVTNGEPYASVFPNGVIPSQGISPAAKGTLGYIPLPNVGTNYFASAAFPTDTVDDIFGQRVDFMNKLTGNWSVYYLHDGSHVASQLGESNFPGFPDINRVTNQQVTLSNTRIIGPTAVNEFRMSFTRLPNETVPTGSAPPSLTSLGFETGAANDGVVSSGPAGFQGLPMIQTNEFQFGTAYPGVQNQNTYQIQDNFSKIAGRNTLKFGADFRYYQMNQRNSSLPLGNFGFTGNETGGTGDAGENGTDFADYMIGAPYSYYQSSEQILDSRSKYGAAYGQDSFHLKTNLTLNFGLRWEFSQPWYDTQNKIVALIPGRQSQVIPSAPPGLLFPGDPGVARTLAPTRYDNVAPRFGAAYSPNYSNGLLGKIFGGPGKTSIRVAGGKFYTAVQDQTLYWEIGTVPFGEYWGSPASPLFEQPYTTRSTGQSQGHPFPFVIPPAGSAESKNFNFAPYLPLAWTLGYSTTNALPYSMDYNFTIERQLTASTVLSVGYVGNVGRKLLGIQEANPGNPALCLSLMGSGVMPGTQQCGPGQEDRTFTRPDGTSVHGTRTILGPDFSTTYYEGQWANSDYNSLQASLKKRAGNSSYLFGYTFSKAMDNASFFNSRMNPDNHAIGRSLSTFDATHNFVASYIYTFPFDRAFSSLPKRLTRGWSIAGITKFSTGFPVTMGESDDRALRGTSNADEPNIVAPVQLMGNPRKTNSLGVRDWFNPSSFTTENLGQWGGANRRFFHGPGNNNWDLGLHKDTQLRESVVLQIRAEAFNTFNHTQFGGPDGYVNDGTFGQILGAASPRIMQVAAKIIF